MWKLSSRLVYLTSASRMYLLSLSFLRNFSLSFGIFFPFKTLYRQFLRHVHPNRLFESFSFLYSFMYLLFAAAHRRIAWHILPLVTFSIINSILISVNNSYFTLSFFKHALSNKCPYSELFSCSFSSIWTEYREIRCIFPYFIWMLENADQNNSEYRHFPHIDAYHANIGGDKKWAGSSSYISIHLLRNLFNTSESINISLRTYKSW